MQRTVRFAAIGTHLLFASILASTDTNKPTSVTCKPDKLCGYAQIDSNPHTCQPDEFSPIWQRQPNVGKVFNQAGGMQFCLTGS